MFSNIFFSNLYRQFDESNFYHVSNRRDQSFKGFLCKGVKISNILKISKVEKQGWEFALLLFCSFALLLFCSFALLLYHFFALLLFCSFALLLFTLSLKIALLKERPRAIHSSHSLKKELRERFALWKEQIAISFFRSQKTSDSLEKPKSEFPI